ncbi:MAG: hypothetical protein AB7T49_11815 [Oligoflexales bacterium]
MNERQEFYGELSKFTKKSLGWCTLESEKSTTNITDTITLLLSDTQRVSKLSKESLAAIKQVGNKFQGAASLNAIKVGDLIATLVHLCKEHEELGLIIEPIIHSLQFQDRFRQNLENIAKMVDVWLAERAKTVTGDQQAALSTFGEKLAKCTTMREERDVLRKHIPNINLPPERTEEVTFF